MSRWRAQQERVRREAGKPLRPRDSSGRGRVSRSTVTPRPLHSSSIASEPTSPAMLTSLAATQAPEDATVARTRTSPARSARTLLEGPEEGEVGAHRRRSVHAATISDWPRATWVVESTASARPTPNADSAGGPSCSVRWPAGQGDVVPGTGSLHPAQCLTGQIGAADDGVDDRQRYGAHRGQVVDVGQDSRDARAVGVAGHEGGKQRLATGDHLAGIPAGRR